MITPTDWIQAISMVILVVVTIVYAWRTHVISEATREQADASVKMAEEATEQRIMSSRPVIIQKAVREGEKKVHAIDSSYSPAHFSHFEIFNAGNGPAVELEISLLDRLDRERTSIHSHRENFLRAGELPLEFHPFNLDSLEESKTYYLACEYQSILSRDLKIWYQTLLPFKSLKSGKEGKIYVNSGELEFKDNVPENKRIDACSSRSKPK